LAKTLQKRGTLNAQVDLLSTLSLEPGAKDHRDQLGYRQAVTDLILSGSPVIVVDGPDWDQFAVEQQPAPVVAPQGSTTFIIRFRPGSLGPKTAWIAIVNK
jgi:hypothetical protein